MNDLVKDKIIFDSITPVELYGIENENIDFIQSVFRNLLIIPRGNEIILEGSQDQVQKIKSLINQLIRYFKKYKVLSKSDIETIISIDDEESTFSTDYTFYGKNGTLIKPRTVNQRQMISLSFQHPLLFVLGAAGTGKTYLSVVLALRALQEKKVKKIILTRPAVEAGENLGFLPGDLYDKLSPYMTPLYDALGDMLSKEKLNFYLKNNYIEIVPLAFMRGRTLDKSFVILDEAQNTTVNQMKMFLTRMGIASRFIVVGDPSQIDLPSSQKSGLIHATKLLKSLKGIGFIKFDERDVIRHELVKSIIKVYNK